MDYALANKVLQHIHLRKGWKLDWVPGPRNTISVQIQGMVDDSSDYPRYQRKSIAHGRFYVDLNRVPGPAELIRLVLDSLIEMAIHEEREFLRVGPKWVAPFHPHTDRGERNYKLVTSYRTAEPLRAVAVGTTL